MRCFLPVQLGVSETNLLSETLARICKNYAGAPPHKFRTISARFRMPLHIFRPKFSGTCRDCPAHKFSAIFSGAWHVLKICVCTLSGNERLKAALIFFGGWVFGAVARSVHHKNSTNKLLPLATQQSCHGEFRKIGNPSEKRALFFLRSDLALEERVILKNVKISRTYHFVKRSTLAMQDRIL